MKNAFIAGALIFTLAAAAQAESLTEKTEVNAALGVSPSTADFVNEAAISDMFEIQSSRLAEDRAHGSAASSFAAQMVKDHGKTSAELKAMVEKGAVKQQLPTALDKSHQKTLDDLKDAKGDDFLKMYADDQLSGHKDAVDLFERYAKGGDNDALKQWASKTLPTLRHHLDMAQDLDKDPNGRASDNGRTNSGRSAYE